MKLLLLLADPQPSGFPITIGAGASDQKDNIAIGEGSMAANAGDGSLAIGKNSLNVSTGAANVGIGEDTLDTLLALLMRCL